jgi:hypothetical protein
MVQNLAVVDVDRMAPPSPYKQAGAELCCGEKFCWRRWGSLLPVLHTLDPPLSPPSTQRKCLGGGVIKIENFLIISGDSKHVSV